MRDARMTEIGRRVRELRRAAGLRQQDLADRIGVARSSVANIESGQQGQMTIGRLTILADTLGSSVGEIVATPSMPWLELARRNQAARVTYTELAEQCWRGHDYLTAIRYRGIAEGLEMATTHQIEVATA